MILDRTRLNSGVRVKKKITVAGNLVEIKLAIVFECDRMLHNLIRLHSEKSGKQLPVLRAPCLRITCHGVYVEIGQDAHTLHPFEYGPFPVVKCIAKIFEIHVCGLWGGLTCW